MVAAEEYLQPGTYIDSDHPAVAAFARRAARGATGVERAVSLYYAVRDGIRYNPFLDFTVDSAYRASSCLEAGEGFCVGKAALLAACGRAEGIPARVGFADVKNHLSTPRLLEHIGSDLFIYHGYAELHLEEAWVKCDSIKQPPFHIHRRILPRTSLLERMTLKHRNSVRQNSPIVVNAEGLRVDPRLTCDCSDGGIAMGLGENFSGPSQFPRHRLKLGKRGERP